MKRILHKQIWHLLFLIVAITLIIFVIKSTDIMNGQLFGIQTNEWFWISIAIPVIHQTYLILAWRGELEQKWMTKIFGRSAFTVHMIIFLLLLISRPTVMFILGISSRESFILASEWRISLTILSSLILGYLFYSIHMYFGIKRAVGIDHFDPEYRNKPLVREGIFKYTRNAMYTFALLLFWIPGILFASWAGLLSALFSHCYIWVHYYVTEKPDMIRIYGDKKVR